MNIPEVSQNRYLISLWSTFDILLALLFELVERLAKVNTDIPEVRILDLPVVHL